MFMSRRNVLIPFLVVLVLTGACRQEEPQAPSAGTGGEVTATDAYRTYFGEPPTVAAGTCFAVAGFLPVPGDMQRIRPFPLFMIGEEARMEALLEQLLRWEVGSAGAEAWVNPFPPGSELISLTREGEDLVRVELSEPAWSRSDGTERQGMVLAVGYALAQFQGVKRVMVVAGGHLLPGQAERGFFPVPDAVIDPGPPRLLSLVGIWEGGEDDPAELSAYFDRPLEVETFLLLEEGREVAGDYYRSVFDMAVVVHPEHPQRYREGMELKVAWKVKDRLGRGSEGEGNYLLQRLEHR